MVRSNVIRAALSTSILCGTMGFGGQAEAQQQPAAESDEVQDEIVVTAQRRSERLQDVPISITVLSASQLANSGIQDTRDLPLLTPGLRVDSVGTYVQPAIRGVTTTLTSGPEANVATYLDGVYRPDTFGAVYDLPDVQQIEVLKGPQGTLFGRNATGGAILITTRKPDLQVLQGEGSVGYASFNTYNINGFVSVPIAADSVALSLTGYYEDVSDGWKRNLLTGKREGAGLETALVRGKLRFVPWAGADFTLTGLYSIRNDETGYRPSIYQGNHDLAGTPGVVIPVRPWDYAIDHNARQENKSFDLSLRGEIEAGPGTLTTTTAYSRTRSSLLFDTSNVAEGGGFATTNGNYESYSQELVYATEQLGRVRAVLGLFFFDSEFNQQPYFVPQTGFQLWFRDAGRSYAAFGELTFDITDRLSLTGGLRYSSEKREGATAFAFGQPPFTRPALIPIGEETWNDLTPRVSAVFKASPSTNLYATYSQGFKSGIFNVPSAQVTPVDPENIDAFEVGIKSSISPGLRVDAAAFHYNYTNLQVPSIEQVGAVLNQRILNAASAKITGAELSVNWNPTNELSFILGGSWLDAKYEFFPAASVNVPVRLLPVPPGNSICTEVVKPTSGLCNIIADVSGNRMIRTPEWSGSLTANYNREFDSGTLSLSGTIYYSSKVFMEFNNRVVQPSYAKINASAGWRFGNGIMVRVWGRNLTDRAVLTNIVSTNAYDGVDYERPRELGVEISARF
jgi:iron complex outermembrane recepter protein